MTRTRSLCEEAWLFTTADAVEANGELKASGTFSLHTRASPCWKKAYRPAVLAAYRLAYHAGGPRSRLPRWARNDMSGNSGRRPWGSGFTTEAQRSQRRGPHATESSVCCLPLIGVYPRLSAVAGQWLVIRGSWPIEMPLRAHCRQLSPWSRRLGGEECRHYFRFLWNIQQFRSVFYKTRDSTDGP